LIRTEKYAARVRWSGTFARFLTSEMTFFRPARDENLRVEGPPMVGWQMTQFARMRSSLLQWSFCCPCSRSAAVRSYGPSSNKRSFRAPCIRTHITKTTGCTRIRFASYLKIIIDQGTLTRSVDTYHPRALNTILNKVSKNLMLTLYLTVIKLVICYLSCKLYQHCLMGWYTILLQYILWG